MSESSALKKSEQRQDSAKRKKASKLATIHESEEVNELMESLTMPAFPALPQIAHSKSQTPKVASYV